MADSDRRFHCKGEILFPDPESHIYETDQYRYLYQRADNRGKSLSRVYPENRHGHGYGQFKIVRGGSEAQRSGLLVGSPCLQVIRVYSP